MHNVQEKTCGRLHTVQCEGMNSKTQYRVVFNGGFGTRWFDTEAEALASVWLKEDGAKIITREYSY